MRQLAVAVALIALLALPVTAAAEPDPTTCSGYPQPRVGVEIQSWWQDRSSEAFPGRHIHIFTCWPTGVVSGTLGLDLRIQTHAQPTGNYFKRLRATDGGGSNVFPVQTSGFTPLDDAGNMVQWIHKDINTSSLSTGLHEIRLAGYVRQTRSTPSTSDDFDQLVSSDLPLFVRSMSGGATSRDYVEARSWYPSFNYTNERYRNRLSDWLQPKTGSFVARFQCASPSGVDGKRQVIAVDPSYHDLNLGAVLFDKAGEGYADVIVPALPTGAHKIVARCEGGPYSLNGHDGTSTGVLAINFTVN